MYMFLIRDGDVHFNDQIPKYVEELVEATKNIESSNGKLVDWSQVTIWDLASQLSGLGNIRKRIEVVRRLWRYAHSLQSVMRIMHFRSW